VTDPLARLAPAAAPLLHRVDDVLAQAGIAGEDPIWPLLRRVRALPSAAVAAVAGWRADPCAAGALRALARRYEDAVDGLPRYPPWEGAGAQGYARHWGGLRAHVVEGLAGRLRDTATYADEVADWVARSRRAVAVALADVLGSAEAVTLVTGGQPAAPAAARVGGHVLAPVALACEEAIGLHDDWRARLAPLEDRPHQQPGHRPHHRPYPTAAPAGTGTVRVGE
jgi:hypothetical protein